MGLTYDDVSGVVKTSIRPRVQTNWKNKSVLAMKLLKEERKKPIVERITDGYKVPIFYTKNGGGKWYVKDTPLPNPQSPTTTAAQYGYKFGAVGIGVYGSDLARVTGPDAIEAFVNIRKQNAQDEAWDLVGKGMYSSAADTADMLSGLDAMFDNDPYGKLTAADVIGPDATTVWAATKKTKAALTMADLGKYLTLTWDGADDRPDFGITRPSGWNKIWSLVQPQERYEPKDEQDDVRKAGFVAIVVNRCPIYADTYCPGSDGGSVDNKLYLLQLQYLDMLLHPDRNFSISGPIQVPEMDGMVWRILIALNLVCSRRKRQFRLDGWDTDL